MAAIQIMRALALGIALFASTGFAETTGQANNAVPENPSNGQVAVIDGERLAWDAYFSEWARMEQFWANYIAINRGLTWGWGDTYPPYRQVREGDLFLVRVEGGDCLMEFFHRRWRRANDVRRWDPAFNEFGGCPNVFK